MWLRSQVESYGEEWERLASLRPSERPEVPIDQALECVLAHFHEKELRRPA
jgi:hypothetical protein